jgi:hypothetical protein
MRALNLSEGMKLFEAGVNSQSYHFDSESIQTHFVHNLFPSKPFLRLRKSMCCAV